jgi:trans-aconitate 2-methyltransferase
VTSRSSTDSTGSWDPQQYRRFAAERSQPFHDLLEMIETTGTIELPIERAVDLGCGPGELTVLAADRLAAGQMTGIDNSPTMLASAAEHVRAGVRFEAGDIAQWTSDGDHDLVLAAASLQWVPDHAGVIERWTVGLRAGGRLAVQVPANSHAATHVVAGRLARSNAYRAAFGPAGPPVDPVAEYVLRPDDYARILYRLGYVDITVLLRVYPHVLPTPRHAVEWVKGTTLTRFRNVLDSTTYEAFLADYERELVAELGDDEPCFFPFSRILFVASRP